MSYKPNSVVQMSGAFSSVKWQYAAVIEVLTKGDMRGSEGDVLYKIQFSTGEVRTVKGSEILKQVVAPPFVPGGEWQDQYASAFDKSKSQSEIHLTIPPVITFHLGDGKSPKELTVLEKGKDIFFRGEDRNPSVVFRDGFTTRSEVYGPVFKTMQGDVRAESGTCASRDPLFGCLFPLIDFTKKHHDEVFLYLLYPEYIYSVDKLQRELIQRPYLQRNKPDAHASLVSNAVAQEVMAPGKVSGQSVAGCYALTRDWNGATYDKGLTFTISGEFLPNPNAVGQARILRDAAVAKMVPLVGHPHELKAVEEGGRPVGWSVDAKTVKPS
ncbi:hypothetical protein ACIQUL_29440 [Streptomyces sp. NPDC090303]|uniref:hypothetical protein n=1 Tax=Streptomyces sp. NPDC090303 TaxID=3365960 RepID=UPI0038119229